MLQALAVPVIVLGAALYLLGRVCARLRADRAHGCGGGCGCGPRA